jgi:hypothetical protein
MTGRIIIIAPISLVCLLGLALIAGQAGANEAAASPWRTWQTICLRARSIPFFTGNLKMRLNSGSGNALLETESTARFFGARIAHSKTVSVIDLETGRPEKYESYSRKRGRRYIFGERSYTVEKLRPPADRGSIPQRWVVHSRNEFAYPETAEGTSVDVFDYYGMLLRLRSIALKKTNDEVTMHVATSKGPQAYHIRVSDVRSSLRRLTDLRTGEKRSLPVRELRLRITPADPEQADEGFLEMEGEVELWVEAGSKTPLLLSGKIPKIPGRIKLVLTEMG